ncbi:MAG: monovalent cation/H+ antiporter complex subunit F [bacterium]|nr:monovalent cation/H+ antiporter complex subunit F [bacterium]
MTAFMDAAAVYIALLMFLSLYRAIIGPRTLDRLVATNVIATKTVLLICWLAVTRCTHYYVDVALVFALGGFTAAIAVVKAIGRGELR